MFNKKLLKIGNLCFSLSNFNKENSLPIKAGLKGDHFVFRVCVFIMIMKVLCVSGICCAERIWMTERELVWRLLYISSVQWEWQSERETQSVRLPGAYYLLHSDSAVTLWQKSQEFRLLPPQWSREHRAGCPAFHRDTWSGGESQSV